ncbi:signal recognition particle subunit srp68 [Dimargaris verticillata]|uniref:Signal recognition particle subunit SRP68 n=1 Tax=Dimargaris verticillata TaxID=2761393 RepID=A0A9W8BC81_9FUNG|nr:signal recognition particle subunit srp68 [Dimargaris verticillata]
MDIDALSTLTSGGSAAAPSLPVQVLAYVHEARQNHGLPLQDYTRYRHYCTRELQKVRKELQARLGNGSTYSPQTVTPEDAERAWSYGRELKEESVSSGEPRQRHHHVRRLRKGLVYARQLLLATTSLPAAYRLAYYTYYLGLWAQELLATTDWTQTLAVLVLTRLAYRRILTDDTQLTSRAFVQAQLSELDPQLRYCAYKLRLDTSDDWTSFASTYYQAHEAQIWQIVADYTNALAAKPFAEALDIDELKGLLTAPQTNEAQPMTLDHPTLTWRGLTVEVKSPKVIDSLHQAMATTQKVLAPTVTDRVPMASADKCLTSFAHLVDVLSQTPGAHNSAAPAAWNPVLRAWQVAAKLCDKLDTTDSHEALLRSYPTFYHRLCSIHKLWAQLAQLDTQPTDNASSPKLAGITVVDSEQLSGKRRTGGVAKVVTILDGVLAHLDVMRRLPLSNLDHEFAHGVELVQLLVRAQRCMAVGHSYDVTSQPLQALALYERARTLLVQCKSQLGNRLASVQQLAQTLGLGFQQATLGPLSSQVVASAAGGSTVELRCDTDLLANQLTQVNSLVDIIRAKHIQSHARWCIGQQVPPKSTLQQPTPLGTSNQSPPPLPSDSEAQATQLADLLQTVLTLDGASPSSASGSVAKPVIGHLDQRIELIEVAAPAPRNKSGGNTKHGNPPAPRKVGTASSAAKPAGKKPVKRKQHPTENATVTRTVPYITDFPPRFQAVPHKPMLFDLAGSHIDIPVDLIQKRAGKGGDTMLGGIKGILGNIWGRS